MLKKCNDMLQKAGRDLKLEGCYYALAILPASSDPKHTSRSKNRSQDSSPWVLPLQNSKFLEQQ